MPGPVLNPPKPESFIKKANYRVTADVLRGHVVVRTTTAGVVALSSATAEAATTFLGIVDNREGAEATLDPGTAFPTPDHLADVVEWGDAQEVLIEDNATPAAGDFLTISGVTPGTLRVAALTETAIAQCTQGITVGGIGLLARADILKDRFVVV